MVGRLRLGRPPGRTRGIRLAGAAATAALVSAVCGGARCYFVSQKLWSGDAPEPPNDRRAPSPWARSAGAGSPDGARGPRGHRQPFRRRERASTRFPQLDHPPRGCRVPRPKARNRGYSYPSGSGVRALQAIPRPRIPRNGRQNAQNGRESGFQGSTGYGRAITWMAATQSAKEPPTGGSREPQGDGRLQGEDVRPGGGARRGQPNSRQAGSPHRTGGLHGRG